MIPLLLGITLISFAVIHLAPGSPTDMQTTLNPKASLEAQKRLREIYGLDKPLMVQYGDWLTRLARLDFGRSFSPDRRPVWDKIKERIGITLSLNLMSLIIILGGVHPHRGNRRLPGPIPGLTRPPPCSSFSVSPCPLSGWPCSLMHVFRGLPGLAAHLGPHLPQLQAIYPLAKLQDLGAHVTLPVLVAAFGGLAGMSRYMRGNMLEVIRQDYIITARAKGLPERVVIFKHALRNALLPVITILGLSVPGLIGGSVIFESIFAIPGMGQLFYGAVMARDYPLVMGELVIGAVLTLVGNMLADVGYALVDPRIRAG